jgi:DNA-directed RNA polymerase specialized sigma24 family protein
MEPVAPHHPLDDPWPPFLDALDSEPAKAWEGFYRFAVRLLRSRPPRIFASLSIEEREDVISTIVLHCCRDEFRMLRTYRNMGRPFAAWLVLVARNRALDRLKQIARAPSNRGLEMDRSQPVDPRATALEVAEVGQALEVTRRCIGELGESCRLLLWGAAEGLTPKGLTSLLGWPTDWNKKASDALRECRRQLRLRLAECGVNPLEYFSARRGV